MEHEGYVIQVQTYPNYENTPFKPYEWSILQFDWELDEYVIVMSGSEPSYELASIEANKQFRDNFKKEQQVPQAMCVRDLSVYARTEGVIEVCKAFGADCEDAWEKPEDSIDVSSGVAVQFDIATESGSMRDLRVEACTITSSKEVLDIQSWGNHGIHTAIVLQMTNLCTLNTCFEQLEHVCVGYNAELVDGVDAVELLKTKLFSAIPWLKQIEILIR